MRLFAAMRFFFGVHAFPRAHASSRSTPPAPSPRRASAQDHHARLIACSLSQPTSEAARLLLFQQPIPIESILRKMFPDTRISEFMREARRRVVRKTLLSLYFHFACRYFQSFRVYFSIFRLSLLRLFFRLFSFRPLALCACLPRHFAEGSRRESPKIDMPRGKA